MTPPQLDSRAYLDHLQNESARFRAVLADTPREARVPSCPGWSADDLLWHLTEVHQTWLRAVTDRPTAPSFDDLPARPDEDEALFDLFDLTHAEFVAALREADPEEAAWSWSTDPDHHRVGWILRRQAHEALIHRRDAELAADQISPFDTDLAADGVAEVLQVMYGGDPGWGQFTPESAYAEFRMPDARASVWVQPGSFSGTAPGGEVARAEPDFRVVSETDLDPDSEAEVVVLGAAADLDAWLWHRRDDTGIEAVGDLDLFARIREILRQPID